MPQLEYTELPERARELLERKPPPDALIDERVAQLGTVESPTTNQDGDTEVLHGVVFTHHFVEASGDAETVLWHYVETGAGEPIVFLHGIPDSWFQWYHQMAALSTTHRCIAVDLKGYGQWDKKPGDYRHEGAAEQLFTMLQKVGITELNLVSHDRGTAQGDFIVANHPESVLRYGRGEQHLYHFNPALAPQAEMFMNAPATGLMKDRTRFVVWVYAYVIKLPISVQDTKRAAQEFSYPGIDSAVPRYFHSQTFRQEWLTRRKRLLSSWTCPVLIMQGHDSKTQPREFYVNARDYIPHARSVEVCYLPGGHFWTLESPDETTGAIRRLLEM